jgi:copper homeostasis protein
LFEACVDSVEAAIAAQEGGADRVELCADLLEGGVTPSVGTIRLTCKRLSIPVHVLIRPRAGDFCYSEAEFEVMRLDVEQVLELGADGVVFGLLNADGSVDRERTGALVEAARPLRVTFHRAFDMARDAHKALDELVALDVERVLTSGQEETALEGAELIAELVRRAGERIAVMAGGGVNERNVGRIAAQTGVREVHATARARVESRMEYRHARCSMGGTLRPEEFAWSAASAARVRALVRAVQ